MENTPLVQTSQVYTQQITNVNFSTFLSVQVWAPVKIVPEKKGLQIKGN